MKRILQIIPALLLFAAFTQADELSAEKNLFRKFGTYSLPRDHQTVSIQPGLVVAGEGSFFPMISVSIPFGGPYYVYGGLAACNEPYHQTDLSSFHVGLGYNNSIKKIEDMTVSVNASVQTFTAANFSSMLLGGEALLEKKIQSLHFGLGAQFISQNYEIRDSGIFPDANDRIYMLYLEVIVRSPFGNIMFKGNPENISAGISWTLYPGL